MRRLVMTPTGEEYLNELSHTLGRGAILVTICYAGLCGESPGEALPTRQPPRAKARTVKPPRLKRDELFALVDKRTEAVRHYLLWARKNDTEQRSFRMTARPDIKDAAAAAEKFAEPWWGIVVFTCFGSVSGANVTVPYFQHPLPPSEAQATLDAIHFPRRSVGHHRIQPAVTGAKQALVSACANSELFHTLLHSGDSFDTRYRRLREAHVRQWGRTTSFDLLLRTGTLGIGGQHYKPEYAYLGGSTGPKAGFACVWGVSLNDDATVAWAEALLTAWTEDWEAVADRVSVEWDKPPLEPCDQENFLCIYQEHLRVSRMKPAAARPFSICANPPELRRRSDSAGCQGKPGNALKSPILAGSRSERAQKTR